MSAWDVAVAWIMWNVVMPISGIVLLLIAVAVIGVILELSKRKRREGK